jgi:hypothetical protein
MTGLVLDPWQEWVLHNAMGVRADGKWSAFEVGLVVGRQNGKNSCLEARELAELFLVSKVAGPRTIIHSAHQFKTALEHYRRLKARVRESPELLAQVKRKGKLYVGFRESHGEESIELVDGSRLLFAARTSSGGQGRGFTIDLLVYDEAMNLPDSVVGSVMPTLSARTGPKFLPGPQVIYTGSSVNQNTMPYGVQLARVRERGIKGENPSLFFAEWSVDEDEFAAHPEMADDPRAWAQANPGQGRRISVEHIRNERNGAMPPDEFLTERMGLGDWPPTSEQSQRVIPLELWQSLADPGSRIAKGPVFAIDVQPGQGLATIAAAGARDDGLWHIGIVEHRKGLDWLVPTLRDLLSEFSGSSLVVDPRADLAGLLDELDRAGIQPARTTAADYKDACGAFFRACQEKQLCYMPPQPELDSAVAGARTKPLQDAWKWDRASGAVITPLIASTLALWGARTQGAPTVWSLAEMVAEMRGETAEAEAATKPLPAGFVPLDAVPVRRGLFRP